VLLEDDGRSQGRSEAMTYDHDKTDISWLEAYHAQALAALKDNE
jgi:hypothetical protein